MKRLYADFQRTVLIGLLILRLAIWCTPSLTSIVNNDVVTFLILIFAGQYLYGSGSWKSNLEKVFVMAASIGIVLYGIGSLMMI